MRLNFQTTDKTDVIDITSEVQQVVANSGIKDGIILISVIGSTASISTMEYDPSLVQDQKDLLDKLISSETKYGHNQTWGDGNGFSHLRATIYSPSLTLPIESNELVIGTWQQVVLLDFDNKARDREIVVKIIENHEE